MTRIGQLWQQLLSEPQRQAGWLARRLDAASRIPLYGALRLPDQRKAVLLEVDADALVGVREFPSASGFEVVPEPIRPGPRGQVRLCLLVADAGRQEIFEVLAEDVSAFALEATETRDAVMRLLNRLKVWQAFLRAHSEGLSPQEQEGLYGELQFVRWMLARGVDVAAAMEAWQGPSGGLRDFRFETAELEVKSSTNDFAFSVSGVDQLDESTATRLFLVHYLLQIDVQADCLPDLVDRVREAAGEPINRGRALLEERLLQYGYSDIHRRFYTANRWRAAYCRFFAVNDQFPRVRRNELRQGVLDLRYRVDLSACAGQQVTEDIVESHLIHRST